MRSKTMNNLKFRVWDKKLKLLGNASYIDFDSKKMIYRNGFVNCYVNFEDVEIMQSTGLFDKNGVEIFEGAILTDEGNFENDYWDYATIEFDKTDYTYYIHWKREEVCENITDCYKYTVTGNIYENKELLG
jgi:hypothetical protein